MAEPGSIALVVEDDQSVRDAVKSLLKSVGLHAETFGSTEDFLKAKRPETPSCLIPDVQLPGANGLEFQGQLAKAGIRIPIIFITAHGRSAPAAELIITGTIPSEAVAVKVLSVVMRTKLCGFRFDLENGVLRALQPTERLDFADPGFLTEAQAFLSRINPWLVSLKLRFCWCDAIIARRRVPSERTHPRNSR